MKKTTTRENEMQELQPGDKVTVTMGLRLVEGVITYVANSLYVVQSHEFVAGKNVFTRKQLIKVA